MTLTKLIEDKAEEIVDYHGCLTGDCPCENQKECDRQVVTHSMEVALTPEVLREVPEVKALIDAIEQDQREYGKSKLSLALKPFQESGDKDV